MSFVKITSNIRVNEGGIRSIIRLKNSVITKRIQNMAVKTLQADSPVKSGRFRNSIKAIESKQRQSGGIFQGFVKIGPTAAHSKFVMRRTRPSPGVYVPSLGVRTRFGIHPGTPANNIIARNKPRITAKAVSIVNREYGTGRLDIKRFIK